MITYSLRTFLISPSAPMKDEAESCDSPFLNSYLVQFLESLPADVLLETFLGVESGAVSPHFSLECKQCWARGAEADRHLLSVPEIPPSLQG